MRKQVLSSIHRIVKAEATASGSSKEPEFKPLDRYTAVTNDSEATAKVVAAFRENFGEDSVNKSKPTMASEDFGAFGSQWGVPSVFWFFGGADPEVYAEAKKKGSLNTLPSNHNPGFAPVIHPTLETGIKAMIVAAHPWIAPK